MTRIPVYHEFILNCLVQLQKDLNDFISKDYFNKLDEIDKSIIRLEKELADSRIELFHHIRRNGGVLKGDHWEEFTNFILSTREDLTNYLNQCVG